MTGYSWLIVYLTAASPVMDGSFFQDEEKGKTILKNIGSPRCSKIGYWNDFVPVLQYDNLDAYVESIESYVKQGQLKEAAELYYPVRLKPKGENTLNHLKTSGVNHIELRMLDLNPLDPVGIRKEDLDFIHLLLLYLLQQEDREFLPFEQMMAIKNEKNAAKYEEQTIWIETGWNSALPVKNAALSVFSSMERFVKMIEREDLLDIIWFQKQKVFFQKNRYAVQVKSGFGKDYVKQGLIQVQKNAEELAQIVDAG